MEEQPNISESILRLVRVMRRKPVVPEPHRHGFGKLLRMIATNPQTSLRDLAQMMDIRPSSLSELLKRLEEKGMLSRHRDGQDQRVIRVSITELGLVEIKSHDDAKRQVISSVADCLSPDEQRQFCEMCDRMVTHAEQLNNKPFKQANRNTGVKTNPNIDFHSAKEETE